MEEMPHQTLLPCQGEAVVVTDLCLGIDETNGSQERAIN